MSTEIHFSDSLIEACKAKRSCVVVGLDTDPRRLPRFLVERFAATDSVGAKAEAQLAFNKTIVDAVHKIVPAVKVQIAYYELLGPAGFESYRSTIQYARTKGLLVIGDIKRGDIGSTANAYAEAHLLGAGSADAVTVNPYMGADAIVPFLDVARSQGKGVFVLVKTSNPSSSELQDLEVAGLHKRNYEIIARRVGELGVDSIGNQGFSLVGAVVGGTFPTEAKKLRALLPHTLFLVPGYGTQGARADDVAECFNADGLGAVVNASRSIIFAYEGQDHSVPTPAAIAEAATQTAVEMGEEINRAMSRRTN